MKTFIAFLVGSVVGCLLYVSANFLGAYQTPYVDKPVKSFDVRVGSLTNNDAWLSGVKVELIPIQHPESHRALALLRLDVPSPRIQEAKLDLTFVFGDGSTEHKPVIIDSSAVRSEPSGFVWLLLDFGPRFTWDVHDLTLRSDR